MKAPQLETENTDIHLVEPDIERDAALGVQWLDGEIGRATLGLMGVADKDNVPTTLEQEQERVRGFIENENQLNWMIQLDDKVVGSIWADLQTSEHLKAPSVHIMIGDPNARGHNVGGTSLKAVIHYLHDQGNETIYSRYLTNNQGSARLLANAGFVQDGEAYRDADDLDFQNVVLKSDKETAVRDVSIEQAKPSDAEAISELLRITWLATYPNAEAGITEEDIRLRTDGAHGERIPQNIEKWRNNIESDDGTRAIFVARLNNTVIGFTSPRIADGIRRIGAMYVLPENQGMGIGGKLMHQALEWHGDTEDIYLNVASYNHNAIDFYKRFGFEQTDTVVVDEGNVYGNTRIPEIEMVLRAKKQ